MRVCPSLVCAARSNPMLVVEFYLPRRYVCGGRFSCWRRGRLLTFRRTDLSGLQRRCGRKCVAVHCTSPHLCVWWAVLFRGLLGSVQTASQSCIVRQDATCSTAHHTAGYTCGRVKACARRESAFWYLCFGRGWLFYHVIAETDADM